MHESWGRGVDAAYEDSGHPSTHVRGLRAGRGSSSSSGRHGNQGHEALWQTQGYPRYISIHQLIYWRGESFSFLWHRSRRHARARDSVRDIQTARERGAGTGCRYLRLTRAYYRRCVAHARFCFLLLLLYIADRNDIAFFSFAFSRPLERQIGIVRREARKDNNTTEQSRGILQFAFSKFIACR